MEYDAQTGLYYYGVRYLDPVAARWMTADPALGSYLPATPTTSAALQYNENLPGMGGVFNSINLNPYHYAGNNPVKYSDPNGSIFGIDNLISGAVGLVTGAGSEIAIEAGVNVIEGKGAFSNINWKNVAVSAGVGFVAGATELGLVAEGKTAIEAAKVWKTANRALKARRAAMAAGKFRNAAKTAAIMKRATGAKQTIAKSIAAVAATKAVKTLLKQGVNAGGTSPGAGSGSGDNAPPKSATNQNQ